MQCVEDLASGDDVVRSYCGIAAHAFHRDGQENLIRHERFEVALRGYISLPAMWRGHKRRQAARFPEGTVSPGSSRRSLNGLRHRAER